MENRINTVGAMAAIVVVGTGTLFSVINGRTGPNFQKIAVEALGSPVDSNQVDRLRPLEQKLGPLVAIKDAKVVLADMDPANGAPPFISAYINAQFEKKPALLRVVVEKLRSKWVVSSISGTEIRMPKLAEPSRLASLTTPAGIPALTS